MTLFNLLCVVIINLHNLMKATIKRIPDTKLTRRLKRGAKIVREDFEKLSSTSHAESMTAEDF